MIRAIRKYNNCEQSRGSVGTLHSWHIVVQCDCACFVSGTFQRLFTDIEYRVILGNMMQADKLHLYQNTCFSIFYFSVS